MSPRITLALAAAVALVGAYILVVDRPQAQRAEEARHLVHLAKASVVGVTLENPKGTADLARTDESHWMVTRPFAAPAAKYTVSDLLDGVLAIVPQRTVVEKTTDWAAYGLAHPDTRITLRTADRKAVTVELGKASPVSAGIYARTVPGDAVYLLDASARDTLAKSPADIRQKTLADFANADVQDVRIASASGTLAVDRIGPERWRLAGTHPWPADDFKVTDLFFPITTSDAKAFHDGVRNLAPYGLDHPAATVELTLRNRPAPLRLLFAPKGKVTYGMVAGAPTVLELDAGLAARLTPAPISLVSKRVLPYSAPNLTAVAWSRPAGGKAAPSTADAAAWNTLAVRRQGPGFSGGGLSDSQITDMFSSLNLLEADAVEPLATAPPGAPAFRIHTDGGEGAQFDVLVYRRPGGGWLAANAALGLQYRLPSNAFDNFPAPVTAFLGVAKPAPAQAAPRHTPNAVTPTGGPGPASPHGGRPAAPAKPATP
ncbi:MAG TPA: DUF4340 domain-containing protein [bacterium]|nr:DUF4340 domain-containing protein [bacterium]